MTYECGPSLKNSQKQVLYGTILGGSSIVTPKKGKNCYLAMRDCDFQWLSYKVETLRDFFKMDNSVFRKDKNTYRCFSIAYPVFNEVYEMFYDDEEKVILRSTLEILTDEAWMVWFVDAGKKTEQNVHLRTHKFGKQGNGIIADYFNSVDCPCEVQNLRERYEIVFTNAGSLEFLKYIAPRLPKFLVDKYD